MKDALLMHWNSELSAIDLLHRYSRDGQRVDGSRLSALSLEPRKWKVHNWHPRGGFHYRQHPSAFCVDYEGDYCADQESDTKGSIYEEFL